MINSDRLGRELVNHARKRDAIAENASSGLPVAECVRRSELGAVTRSGRRVDADLAQCKPAVAWTLCESVDLMDEEPDWESLTYGYPETQLYRQYETLYVAPILPDDPDPGFCARCPAGNFFLQANGYRPGDRCLGDHPSIGGSRPTGPPFVSATDSKAKPCSHVFTLSKTTKGP